MLPVQIGSGVNLLGYYMFHGGRNPVGVGGTGLEESSLSGGYNDTPRINYDFQAPLGPDGQQREVLTKLRPYHYFLREHAARLATMSADSANGSRSSSRALRGSVSPYITIAIMAARALSRAVPSIVSTTCEMDSKSSVETWLKTATSSSSRLANDS